MRAALVPRELSCREGQMLGSSAGHIAGGDSGSASRLLCGPGRMGVGIKHLPDCARQQLVSERFRQQLHIGVEPFLMKDGAAGITCRIEDLQRRLAEQLILTIAPPFLPYSGL